MRATTMYEIDNLPLPDMIKAYLQSYWGLVDVLRLREAAIRASLRDLPSSNHNTRHIDLIESEELEVIIGELTPEPLTKDKTK